MPIRKRRKKSEINQGDNLLIITIVTDLLTPHPQNTRMHDEKNIQAIARSLTKFGQRTPLVIGNSRDSEGRHYILKGCGTWEAMKRIGLMECSVVQVKHLSEAEELAYSIADNKTGDMSEFDFENLADVMRHLQDEGVELSDTGFADYEIEPLLSSDGLFESDPDDTNDKQTKGVNIKFTTNQWDILKSIISLWRSTFLDKRPPMSDADCIMGLAKWYARAWNEEPIRKKKTPPRKKKA